MTTVISIIPAKTGVFFALAAHQMDTPSDVRGYVVLLAAVAKVTNPTDIHQRVGAVVCGSPYFHTVIREYVDAVDYLPPAAGTMHGEVAYQIALAHCLGKPVYENIGRKLVEETAPARLAA